MRFKPEHGEQNPLLAALERSRSLMEDGDKTSDEVFAMVAEEYKISAEKLKEAYEADGSEPKEPIKLRFTPQKKERRRYIA
ncbi:MAG: hypothetical protein KGH93_02295 [Patescibacteria group bacterium]|nr:hypothetical protein [Patescibacteria group bacterium]MDE1946008.1 hypothetical protein [Patescibacteria group bacterium]